MDRIGFPAEVMDIRLSETMSSNSGIMVPRNLKRSRQISELRVFGMRRIRTSRAMSIGDAQDRRRFSETSSINFLPWRAELQ